MKKIILSIAALSALTGSALAASSSGAEMKTAAYYNAYHGGAWTQQSVATGDVGFATPSDGSSLISLKKQGLDIQQER